VQSQERINLELELVHGSPISGRLTGAAIQADFVGWTELVASLRRALEEREPAAIQAEDG
jgi:hypothetical protein